MVEEQWKHFAAHRKSGSRTATSCGDPSALFPYGRVVPEGTEKKSVLATCPTSLSPWEKQSMEGVGVGAGGQSANRGGKEIYRQGRNLQEIIIIITRCGQTCATCGKEVIHCDPL